MDAFGNRCLLSGKVAMYYQDDSVKIFNNNCVDILPCLNKRVDLILTSPPYDNLRDYGGYDFEFEIIAEHCANALVEGGVLVWIVGDSVVGGSETCTSFKQAIFFVEELGLRLHDTMIYEIAQLNNPTPNRYHQAFQYMFVLSRGKPKTTNLIEDVVNVTAGEVEKVARSSGRTKNGVRTARNVHRVRRQLGRRSNIWRYTTGYNHSAPDFLEAHEHPAIMPLALAKDHVRTWTNAGDVVLDPMMGSGTTLRAAKDLNRLGIGIETYEPYCALAKRRLAQGVLQIESVF